VDYLSCRAHLLQRTVQPWGNYGYVASAGMKSGRFAGSHHASADDDCLSAANIEIDREITHRDAPGNQVLKLKVER
jgi:hypothetical protein